MRTKKADFAGNQTGIEEIYLRKMRDEGEKMKTYVNASKRDGQITATLDISDLEVEIDVFHFEIALMDCLESGLAAAIQKQLDLKNLVDATIGEKKKND